jgi:hypothetical protein
VWSVRRLYNEYEASFSQSGEWEYNSTQEFSSRQEIATGISWWMKIGTVNCK